jgi:1,2-phenylacetyl-CoA epoxidase PaaB subunit
MKSSCIILLMSVVIVPGWAQPSSGPFETSIAADERMALVKNSIHLSAWHEKPFWKLYDSYSAKKGSASFTYATVAALAQTDRNLSDEEAIENARNLIAFRLEEIDVWEQYYAEVGAAHNGIIALQFLQTETLLDIMESCNIYEATPRKNFYFHPHSLNSTKTQQAKHNAMTKALGLKPEEKDAFFTIYSKFEEECGDMLGENYDLYQLYIGDPSDYTPMLAKTLGHNMLQVMRREVRLKEKYFTEISMSINRSTAARFLAWEDYYSSVSKMYVWNDAP